MSLRQAEGVSIAQALAMTVAEIPVFLYSTFGQVNLLKYRTTIHSDVQSHVDNDFFVFVLKILLSEGLGRRIAG